MVGEAATLMTIAIAVSALRASASIEAVARVKSVSLRLITCKFVWSVRKAAGILTEFPDSDIEWIKNHK